MFTYAHVVLWPIRARVLFELFYNIMWLTVHIYQSCGVSCEILEDLRSPKCPIFRRRNWRSRGLQILFTIWQTVSIGLGFSGVLH